MEDIVAAIEKVEDIVQNLATIDDERYCTREFSCVVVDC